MAFMMNEIIDLKGILLLMLLTISSQATNLDCNGKAFHCVNSTHFMICVDLGRGMSTTIDDFVIPCPATTVCRPSNRFECEFPVRSPMNLPEVNVVSDTLSEVTVFNPEATTSIPFEEYYNTVSTTSLSQSDFQLQSTQSTLAVETTTIITNELQSNPSDDKDMGVDQALMEDHNIHDSIKLNESKNYTENYLNTKLISHDVTTITNVLESATVSELETKLYTSTPIGIRNKSENVTLHSENATVDPPDTTTAESVILELKEPTISGSITEKSSVYQLNFTTVEPSWDNTIENATSQNNVSGYNGTNLTHISYEVATATSAQESTTITNQFDTQDSDILIKRSRFDSDNVTMRPLNNDNVTHGAVSINNKSQDINELPNGDYTTKDVLTTLNVVTIPETFLLNNTIGTLTSENNNSNVNNRTEYSTDNFTNTTPYKENNLKITFENTDSYPSVTEFSFIISDKTEGTINVTDDAVSIKNMSQEIDKAPTSIFSLKEVSTSPNFITTKETFNNTTKSTVSVNNNYNVINGTENIADGHQNATLNKDNNQKISVENSELYRYVTESSFTVYDNTKDTSNVTIDPLSNSEEPQDIQKPLNGILTVKEISTLTNLMTADNNNSLHNSTGNVISEYNDLNVINSTENSLDSYQNIISYEEKIQKVILKNTELFPNVTEASFKLYNNTQDTTNGTRDTVSNNKEAEDIKEPFYNKVSAIEISTLQNLITTEETSIKSTTENAISVYNNSNIINGTERDNNQKISFVENTESYPSVTESSFITYDNIEDTTSVTSNIILIINEPQDIRDPPNVIITAKEISTSPNLVTIDETYLHSTTENIISRHNDSNVINRTENIADNYQTTLPYKDNNKKISFENIELYPNATESSFTVNHNTRSTTNAIYDTVTINKDSQYAKEPSNGILTVKSHGTVFSNNLFNNSFQNVSSNISNGLYHATTLMSSNIFVNDTTTNVPVTQSLTLDNYDPNLNALNQDSSSLNLETSGTDSSNYYLNHNDKNSTINDDENIVLYETITSLSRESSTLDISVTESYRDNINFNDTNREVSKNVSSILNEHISNISVTSLSNLNRDVSHNPQNSNDSDTVHKSISTGQELLLKNVTGGNPVTTLNYSLNHNNTIQFFNRNDNITLSDISIGFNQHPSDKNDTVETPLAVTSNNQFDSDVELYFLADFTNNNFSHNNLNSGTNTKMNTFSNQTTTNKKASINNLRLETPPSKSSNYTLNSNDTNHIIDTKRNIVVDEAIVTLNEVSINNKNKEAPIQSSINELNHKTNNNFSESNETFILNEAFSTTEYDIGVVYQANESSSNGLNLLGLIPINVSHVTQIIPIQSVTAINEEMIIKNISPKEIHDKYQIKGNDASTILIKTLNNEAQEKPFLNIIEDATPTEPSSKNFSFNYSNNTELIVEPLVTETSRDNVYLNDFNHDMMKSNGSAIINQTIVSKVHESSTAHVLEDLVTGPSILNINTSNYLDNEETNIKNVTLKAPTNNISDPALRAITNKQLEPHKSKETLALKSEWSNIPDTEELNNSYLSENSFVTNATMESLALNLDLDSNFSLIKNNLFPNVIEESQITSKNTENTTKVKDEQFTELNAELAESRVSGTPSMIFKGVISESKTTTGNIIQITTDYTPKNLQIDEKIVLDNLKKLNSTSNIKQITDKMQSNDVKMLLETPTMTALTVDESNIISITQPNDVFRDEPFSTISTQVNNEFNDLPTKQHVTEQYIEITNTPLQPLQTDVTNTLFALTNLTENTISLDRDRFTNIRNHTADSLNTSHALNNIEAFENSLMHIEHKIYSTSNKSNEIHHLANFTNDISPSTDKVSYKYYDQTLEQSNIKTDKNYIEENTTLNILADTIEKNLTESLKSYSKSATGQHLNMNILHSDNEKKLFESINRSIIFNNMTSPTSGSNSAEVASSLGNNIMITESSFLMTENFTPQPGISKTKSNTEIHQKYNDFNTPTSNSDKKVLKSTNIVETEYSARVLADNATRTHNLNGTLSNPSLIKHMTITESPHYSLVTNKSSDKQLLPEELPNLNVLSDILRNLDFQSNMDEVMTVVTTEKYNLNAELSSATTTPPLSSINQSIQITIPIAENNLTNTNTITDFNIFDSEKQLQKSIESKLHPTLGTITQISKTDEATKLSAESISVNNIQKNTSLLNDTDFKSSTVDVIQTKVDTILENTSNLLGNSSSNLSVVLNKDTTTVDSNDRATFLQPSEEINHNLSNLNKISKSTIAPIVNSLEKNELKTTTPSYNIKEKTLDYNTNVNITSTPTMNSRSHSDQVATNKNLINSYNREYRTMNSEITTASLIETLSIDNITNILKNSDNQSSQRLPSSILQIQNFPDVITETNLFKNNTISIKRAQPGIISFLSEILASPKIMNETNVKIDQVLQYTESSTLFKKSSDTDTHSVNKSLITQDKSLGKPESNNLKLMVTKSDNDTKLHPKTVHQTNSTIFFDKFKKKEIYTQYSTENKTLLTNDSNITGNTSNDQKVKILIEHKTINIINSTQRYLPNSNNARLNSTGFSYTITRKNILAVAPPATNKSVSNKFICKHKKRGRYADEVHCRKFYVCVGNDHVIEGMCPENTVFSEIKKQCTKNLSHCIRNNQFRCVAEGRFSDFLQNNVYYICVKNVKSFIKFKLQCQNGYHLNKTSVRCDFDDKSETIVVASKSDNSSIKNYSDQSISSGKLEEIPKKFRCKKEGVFVDSSDCKRYFECKKTDSDTYRQKRKKCDSDETFHRDKKKCVDAESYECPS